MALTQGANYIEKSIISAAQNLTANWVDLGGELNTAGFNTMLIWVNLDINDTNNARIRALAKRESAGADEYEYPIYTAGTTDVGVEGSYFEWTTDEDQKTILQVNLNGLIPYIQLQVQAGVAGASPGQIDGCNVYLI